MNSKALFAISFFLANQVSASSLEEESHTLKRAGACLDEPAPKKLKIDPRLLCEQNGILSLPSDLLGRLIQHFNLNDLRHFNAVSFRTHTVAFKPDLYAQRRAVFRILDKNDLPSLQTTLQKGFQNIPILIQDKSITNDDLRYLSNATRLNLFMCKNISNAGLTHLESVQNLALTRCVQIDDSALHAIPQVKKLNLMHTKVTGSGLVHLTNLKVLNLSFTHIADEGLALLPNPKHINLCLMDCHKITEESAHILIEAREINITGCKGLSEDQKDTIRILRRLHKKNIARTV